MMLGRDAKVELLKGIPLFAQCSKKDLRDIARVTEEVAFDEGTVLIREGEQGGEAFVVVDGTLEVSRGGDAPIAEVGAGQVVGEIALLSNQPRSATVTVATPVRALRIGGTDFVDLLERMPLLWLKVTRALAERIENDERLQLDYDG
jgi:CRP/FNR family cyclic AMP-dependent transcriptional regulator